MTRLPVRPDGEGLSLADQEPDRHIAITAG